MRETAREWGRGAQHIGKEKERGSPISLRPWAQPTLRTPHSYDLLEKSYASQLSKADFYMSRGKQPDLGQTKRSYNQRRAFGTVSGSSPTWMRKHLRNQLHLVTARRTHSR
ncbi:hypothetical protein PIB30_020230 [Stylosanthes scabra]|uniref:Uncharacterized protein n=1 Tax=Stylosanthes scabra TaxID=79078 RepID=A0ABU6T9B7_9FABA|nr:hypothetical protein [Stylosanthes scabra]